MKCIYCKQEIEEFPMGEYDGDDIMCEIDGGTVMAHVHTDCLGKLVGDYITQRIKVEKWSSTPHCKGVDE